MLIEIASAALIVFGAGIALLGSIALARFPDIFMRLHGPTKATTVGIGSVKC
jgi:multicomponent K+:H+ antiporter subunit G